MLHQHLVDKRKANGEHQEQQQGTEMAVSGNNTRWRYRPGRSYSTRQKALHCSQGTDQKEATQPDRKGVGVLVVKLGTRVKQLNQAGGVVVTKVLSSKKQCNSGRGVLVTKLETRVKQLNQAGGLLVTKLGTRKKQLNQMGGRSL